MIAAFDVYYFEDNSASAAVVLFSDYADSEPSASLAQILPKAADYMPGEFYRRELPCILSLLRQIKVSPDELIIDGYVMLGHKHGLGQHLFKSLDEKIPVIGVAKSKFVGVKAVEVYRGKGKKPLYITSAGMDLQEASEKIRTMHGAHRIPTLLKHVDLLARDNARHH